MARLTTLKPRLATLGNRLQPAKAATHKEAEVQRRQQRLVSEPWQKWYGLARWKQLRQQVWARDGYRCQKTGVLCIGKHPADNSAVADHIIPHHGDPDLFWDINNIQTVSKAYHDSEKQRAEKGARR